MFFRWLQPQILCWVSRGVSADKVVSGKVEGTAILLSKNHWVCQGSLQLFLSRGEHVIGTDPGFRSILTSVAVLDIVSSQKSTSIIVSRIESYSHVAISTSHGFHRRNQLLPGCLPSVITSDTGRRMILACMPENQPAVRHRGDAHIADCCLRIFYCYSPQLIHQQFSPKTVIAAVRK